MDKELLVSFVVSVISGAAAGYFSSRYNSRKDKREMLYKSFIQHADILKNYLKFFSDTDELKRKFIAVFKKESPEELAVGNKEWLEMLYKNSLVYEIIEDLEIFGSANIRHKISILKPMYEGLWILMSQLNELIDQKKISNEEMALFLCVLSHDEKYPGMLEKYYASEGETPLYKILKPNEDLYLPEIVELMINIEDTMKREIRKVM